jgi:predicted DNA-binding antitoxin AbrB/MazE fold protein
MLFHKLQAKIDKRGYLELRNLPFKEGTQIEIIISKKKKKKDLQKLICNDHVWTEQDIEAVEHGREIINQWKIS